MTIDMSQFFNVFFDEAEELLAEMERLLLAVDVDSPDIEDLNAIFRAAHSIKGGAATFGLTDLTEVTHVLESLLDRIRKSEMALTSEHVDAFLSAKDILKMQVDGHRLQTAVDQDAVADVRMMLQSLSQGAAAALPEREGPVSGASVASNDGTYSHSFRIELPEVPQRDVDALAAELGLLGSIEKEPIDEKRWAFVLRTNESTDDIIAICSFVLEPEDLKIMEQPAVARQSGSATKSEDELGYGFFEPLETPKEDPGYGFFEPLEPPKEAVPPPVQASAVNQADTTGSIEKKNLGRREGDRNATQESSSIRVGIEKVDQLINLVGELVITQAMIEQRSESLDPMAHEKLLASVNQLTRNTRALQEAVMSIRMMPMDYVFSRFPRMVRDLASKLDKKVEFVTHGAATELDKGLIERIIDPLTHLVRNSVDHGIELPAVRAASGKSETGRLSLSAGHQGGNIVIEVSDDGGGLNRDKILAKAKQQGMAVS
ncbi:MAG: cheA3, partial [Paucimonas sp.]|nr:cheA3 [Paucimonas sp.]